MPTNLDEQRMGPANYPNLSLDLDGDLSYDVGIDPKPQNQKVGLTGVFSRDTMEIATKERPPEEKVKTTQPDLLSWLLSFFYTPAANPNLTQVEKNVNVKGVDFSKPTLRKPDFGVDTKQINNLIKRLKDENDQRKEIQEENSRTLDQQVIDMLLHIRDIKQSLASTTSSEVVNNHKKNSAQKKAQLEVIEKNLKTTWTKNLLGRIQTGLGIGAIAASVHGYFAGSLLVNGVVSVNPYLSAIFMLSQALTTGAEMINKRNSNNLQVESILNEKDITARKEKINHWLDGLKAMLTAVSKTEELTVSTLQKHQDAMMSVMDKQ